MLKLKILLMSMLGMYLMFSAESSFAQDICDIKIFRVDNIKGKVVSDGPKGYEPIARAKIELWYVGDDVEDHVLVTATSSDKNGLFEINNIKKGRYRLEVSKWDGGFIMNFAVIKVGKKSESGKQLMFRLGVNALKPCGGGEVSIASQ